MPGDRINKIIIGIDEAGRGPLAGPVTVAAFWASSSARVKLIRILGGKIRDSKQLSPKRRVAAQRAFYGLRKNGKVNFAVCHISNSVIDKIGISKAIKKGIEIVLKKLDHTFALTEGNPKYIRLDGLLKAPKKYKNQKTIIKGDEKDVFIACASIVAKVTRDALMRRLAKKYPAYSFEIHKGYGTFLHRRLIKKHGLSNLHRVSFCGKL